MHESLYFPPSKPSRRGSFGQFMHVGPWGGKLPLILKVNLRIIIYRTKRLGYRFKEMMLWLRLYQGEILIVFKFLVVLFFRHLSFPLHLPHFTSFTVFSSVFVSFGFLLLLLPLKKGRKRIYLKRLILHRGDGWLCCALGRLHGGMWRWAY